MEKSFVFNSVNGDRRYKAEDFREYFASFISNGVFPNPSNSLQVIANNDMTITIKAGKGWINGAIYINTDDYILNIDVADGVLNRIDRVVLRMDTTERKIYAYVKKGIFASSPTAPMLQRDADAYELGIADIYVRAGVISIIQSNITDLRLSKELCGMVHGTIDQVDTTTIFNQYLEWYKNITGKTEQDLQNIKENLETDFNIWFADVKNILSGDVAGNLLNLINTKVSNEQFDKFKKDTTLQLAGIATEIGTEKLKTNAKDIKSSINELFISASNGKTKVATAITGKGIPASGSDSYDTLSNKIKNIKTGYTQNDLINIENVEFSIKNIFSKNMDSGMLFFIKDYIYVINWKDSIKKYSLDGNLILSKKIDHNGFSSGYYTYFDDIYKIFFHNNSFYIFKKGLKHSGEYYYRVYAETCDIERISAYDFGGQGAYSYYGYGGVAINNDGICCGYNEYSGEVFLFSLSYADVIWSKCLFGWNTKYDFSNIFSDGTDFYISSNYSSGSYYKINVNGDITKLEKKSLPYESNSVMLGEYVYCYDSNKKIWRYNIKTNKTEQIGSNCKYIELDFLRKYLYIYTGSILHKINVNGDIICSYNCTDDHFLGSDKDGCIYFYNNNVINKTTLAYKVLV
ncbi:TPA: phage tail protein [Clostridium botulinum]|uniref:phage tail protein n=1 Tax=Clostridium botulinum TaxID=1491 RepID=UPI001C9A75C8|nr:phage tail protein [Clostridium botulinum]MBY6888756.1 phage tail protein [Clostridium botulinum]HBJ2609730.1 phage tail protein [Clostridium botulinum]HDI3120759.1 phage tail protein [Clostridium botulinum]